MTLLHRQLHRQLQRQLQGKQAWAATSVAAIALFVTGASADLVVPFTETFDNNASSWRELGGAADALWIGDGGPNGNGDGFISTGASFADAGPFGLTLFRGHDDYNSSNGGFVGDWAANGAATFSFDVRHNANVPVNFFARFATSNNFPAFVGIDFGVVLPNTWTTITIDVSDDSFQLIPEGNVEHSDVFSAIGNVQIGLNVPDGMENDTTQFQYDIDNVGINYVPVPGALPVLAFAGLAAAGRRRRV